MARLLITGASGLIGRRVVEAFRPDDEHHLVTLRSDEVDLLIPGAWARTLDEIAPDIVVHLAWSASSLPGYRQHDDNRRWAETTVEAAAIAADRGIRFIGTGTSVDDRAASDPYSQSKAVARDALAARIAAGEIAWLRPFYVFDEEQRSPAVLRAALTARSTGQPVRLSTPGARHDFVHARDAGTAIRTIVDAHIMGLVDIGSGVVTSVAELVEAFDCEWILDGSPSATAASAEAADVAALQAAAWEPVVTNERFGRTSPNQG